MARPKLQLPPEQDVVASIPETTPFAAQGGNDHSFTLQLIIELQRSVAELTATVNGVKSTLDGVKTKVDNLVAWKHAIVGGALTIGFLGGVLYLALNKASEYFVFKTSQATISAPVVSPPAALAPAPK